MEQPSTISVTILDKEYRVSCPPNEQEALLMAARYLNNKMRDIRAGGKVIGIERIAVMAALNISYELTKNRNSAAEEKADTQTHIDQLLGKLDRALASVDAD